MNQATAIHPDALCATLLPAVRAFARRRCRSPQEVDDFCQDALIRILDLVHADRVQQPECVGRFALGVCRRVYSERRRREQRRVDLWEKWGPLAAASVAPPVEFEGVSVQLEGCLSSLTQRAREVIQRTWFMEQTGPEIAGALGMSRSNVRVTRHRALIALRDCLASGGLIGLD